MIAVSVPDPVVGGPLLPRIPAVLNIRHIPSFELVQVVSSASATEANTGNSP